MAEQPVTYKYSLEVEAASPQEANRIVEALVKLYYHLEAPDLLTLAELAEKRPDLIQTAKNFIR